MPRKHQFTHKKTYSKADPAKPGPGRPQKQAAADYLDVATKEELRELVWSGEYDKFVEITIRQHPELACLIFGEVQSTAYCKKLAKAGGTDTYLQSKSLAVANVVNIVARTSNCKRRQLIVVLKSVSALRQCVPTRFWRMEVKQRNLLDRQVTVDFVKFLAQKLPKPPFDATELVFTICLDQCHFWQGCANKGRKRGRERVDEDGQRLSVMQVTVINALSAPVPKVLVGNWTHADATYIAHNGIYTEPFDLVLNYLDPAKCTLFLMEIYKEFVSTFHKVHTETDCWKEAVLSLISKPKWEEVAHQDGATHVDFHTPLLNCDTKSRRDIYRILLWVIMLSPRAIVRRVLADGQGIIGIMAAKVRKPDKWKSIWPDPVDLHAFSHDIFAGHEIYFTALLEPCAKHLQRRHIVEAPANMEDDAHDHHKDFNVIVTAAILVFWFKHLPHAMLVNPGRFHTQIKCNAGMHVMFWYVFQVGIPILCWISAVRKNSLYHMDGLWNWFYHLNRCVHKTQMAKISVIRAVNRYCILSLSLIS
jgi:hypothetical protein